MNQEITVELKNDISIKGTLKSVDQFLNIKLDDISVVEEIKYPHLVSPLSFRRPRSMCWLPSGGLVLGFYLEA